MHGKIRRLESGQPANIVPRFISVLYLKKRFSKKIQKKIRNIREKNQKTRIRRLESGQTANIVPSFIVLYLKKNFGKNILKKPQYPGNTETRVRPAGDHCLRLPLRNLSKKEIRQVYLKNPQYPGEKSGDSSPVSRRTLSQASVLFLNKRFEKNIKKIRNFR